ncbi:liver-expressed antimicrobial peptide 2 isoform X1 [Hyla sarda]|uniref:liver-expressed antimicrobial peptide 2 isoform X1 n=1 Tax=Hyla sarda TaxID=327740 RepID=UPI0024C35D65|nr:liver-expressed antimicrobial peptide 2 isoform X1 [Hyla sarda]
MTTKESAGHAGDPGTEQTPRRQLEAAPLDNERPKTALRVKRMTPFWRTMSMRPVGASCRDDTECLTRLCRNQKCCLKTFADK